MAWIQPLELETWLVNVFAGSSTYFAPIAIFVILGLSAFFRLTGFTMIFMILVFLLMFAGYIPDSLLLFIAIGGGLVVGYVISKIVK
jgi:hypothetical protein